MLLDDFMPQWHFNEYHQILVAAKPEAVNRAMRKADLGRSPFVRPLLALRGLPARLSKKDYATEVRGGSLDAMCKAGPFIQLGDAPPHEYVFGLAGCFWVPSPNLHRLTPGEFLAFDEEGQAKVAANLLIAPLGPDTCRLSTETRIQCLGPKAKRRFRRYWFMIRPFSGLIRLEWLRLIKRGAEMGGAGNG